MKNNSDVKIMLKEALVLLIITLGAGLLLGFVYELTKEPIARQQELAIQRACGEVFEEADSFVEYSLQLTEDTLTLIQDKGVSIGTVYEAKDAEGRLLGYVVEAISEEAYAGDIVLYAGITTSGKLNGISILEISETPGLGMLAEKVLVPQFADKAVESFTYTKTGSTSESEIDAISGATITTKAVTNAVNGALEAVQDILQTNGMAKEGQ